VSQRIMVKSVTRKKGIREISGSGLYRYGERNQGTDRVWSPFKPLPGSQPGAASHVEGDQFHAAYVELSANRDARNREALVVVIKTLDGRSCRIEMQDIHAEGIPRTPTEDFVKMFADPRVPLTPRPVRTALQKRD